MSYDERKLCVTCAWRENCQKKYSLEGNLHCPDFVKDLTIKEEESNERENQEPDTSNCKN